MPRKRAEHEEPVELSPWDESWAERFAKEARLVRERLSGYGLVRIEHVGSTAISGILAKPIVDIVVGMENIELAPPPDSTIWDEMGYEYGHEGGAPMRWLYFIKRSEAGARQYHLHVVADDSEFIAEIIAFRDALRRDPEIAKHYERLKLQLVAKGGSRSEYLDGKEAFVYEVLSISRLS